MKIGILRRPDVLAALAAGLAVAAIGVWAQTAALVGVNYDDAIYALLARSIAEGEGYRLTYLPGSVPGVKYPPVYPASLALFWIFGGAFEPTLWAMKIVNGLYLGLAAGLFVLLLSRRRILEPPAALLVTALAFISGFMMLVASGLLSEPLYLVVLFAALLACDGIDPKSATWRVVGVGFLVALAALTRTVGISLVGAAFVGLAVRAGRRRAFLALATSALLLLPWVAFTWTQSGDVPEALVPRYGAYLQFYLASLGGSPSMALDIVSTNLRAILRTAGANLIPGIASALYAPAGGLLFGLAALGTPLAFRKAPALVSYHWIYVAVISVWAFPPFRFLFILFPVTLALASVALRELVIRARAAKQRQPAVSRPATALALSLALAFALNLAYHDARAVTARVWEDAALATSVVSQEVVDWVSRNTSTEAVIAYEFDPLIALHTGRQAVPNNHQPVHVWYRAGETPVEPLARLLREMSVDVLAVRANVPAAAAPIDALIGRYPGSLELVSVTRSGALIFRADTDAFAPGARPSDAAHATPRSSRR